MGRDEMVGMDVIGRPFFLDDDMSFFLSIDDLSYLYSWRLMSGERR